MVILQNIITFFESLVLKLIFTVNNIKKQCQGMSGIFVIGRFGLFPFLAVENRRRKNGGFGSSNLLDDPMGLPEP